MPNLIEIVADLDQYGCIRLVNFLRATHHKTPAALAVIAPADFAADAFLKPVLDSDPFLFYGSMLER